MKKTNKKALEEIIRVDHAGERGAIKIYEGQLLALKTFKQNEYLNCFFDAYWRDNQDLSDIKNISKLLRKLNIDNDEFFKSINEQSIKNKLIKLTSDAFQKEVFGAPTFIINNKIFWGQDRLQYALEEINSN